MIDRLDRKLLKAIATAPDAPAIDIIRPFLEDKSRETLYVRLRVLEKDGYISRERQRREVLVDLTAKGKEELEARA